MLAKHKMLANNIPADAVSMGPSPPRSVREEDAENGCASSDSDSGHVEEDSPLPSLGFHMSWRGMRRVAGSERAHAAMEKMIQRGELQRALAEWRLNATRWKASSLAVWAVDQGNRKAYEVERALMAENSWATKSIIWEGYRDDPLTVR
jgi:hypothetical protein